MPGTTTEPKSTPWTVAEQFVEERIKLKQSNSRIVLALRNAKIHRPSLYLSAKKSFKRALEQTTLNAAEENSINTVKTNKTSTFSGCKLERPGLREKAKNLSKIASKNCESELLGKAGRQSDEDSNKLLSCSCKVALDTKSKNPLRIKANSDTKLSVDKSENTVALKTVNVKPWENDVVKGALKTEQIHNQNTDGNIAHLTFLMQECNAQRSNEIGKHGCIRQSCQPDAGNTVQHANQKLLKPESTVYSDDTMSREGNPDCDDYLSGVLLISSKMPPNPCCFHQLRSLDKEQLTTKRHPTETNFAGYTLPPLKRDGNLCLECQCTVSKVSGQQGSGTQSDVDSKQLKRLKYRLLRECALLEKEVSETDSKVPALRPKLANIHPSDSDVEHQMASTLGESFTLPKLYLPHHSTSTQDGKTRPKNADSQIVPDICLSSKGQSCHKLIKVERMNNTNLYRNKTSANKKPAKLLKSKEPTMSAKRCERYKPRDSGHGGRVSLTQLRGFTPHEFPASPIRWIGNTVLHNDETVKEDLIQEKKKTGKNQRRL